MSVINVKIAAAVNMLAVTLLLWQQFRAGQPTPEGKPKVMDKINGSN